MEELETAQADTTRFVRAPAPASPGDLTVSKRRFAQGSVPPTPRAAGSVVAARPVGPSAVPTMVSYEPTQRVPRLTGRRWFPFVVSGFGGLLVAASLIGVSFPGEHANVARAGIEPPVPVVTPLVGVDVGDEIEMAPDEIAAGDPSSRVGVLMISSKPPCRIFIDGKDTGLVTPQRRVEVPAGRRTITLVNAELGIKHSSDVVVSAGRRAKFVRDLTTSLDATDAIPAAAE